MTTLITALYDIGRGQMPKVKNNHRPFSDYLNWLEELLKMKTHLIIFVPPKGKYSGGIDLEQFIKERRIHPTTVIVKPFEELDLYSKREVIEKNQKKRNIKNIEFINPDYIITIFSKFKFILDSLPLTESNHLFWIDAGFFRKGNFAPEGEWPSVGKLELIQDKFIVGGSNFTYGISTKWEDDISTYRNDIWGYFFGGVRDRMVDFSNKVLQYLDIMLEKGLINNEQRVMSRIIREGFPSIVLEDDGSNRKIIRKLSNELDIGLGYPLEERLLLLTVASREVHPSLLDQWEKSAKFYGYNYEILGRDKKWGGWIFRTKEYLKRIKEETTSEVVIISDGTDLFFNGPAKEAYTKFINSGKNVIIGVEQLIAYNKGRNDIYEVEDFFNKKSDTVLKYPNGGFVIGKREAMIELLTINQTNPDDQAGYMDTMFEGIYNFDLDTRGQFVANFPNLSKYTNHFCSIWKYDEDKNRYYNSVTKEYPIAMHFPGSNTEFMSKNARNIQIPETVFARGESSNGNGSGIITFIVAMMILVALIIIFLVNYL